MGARNPAVRDGAWPRYVQLPLHTFSCLYTRRSCSWQVLSTHLHMHMRMAGNTPFKDMNGSHVDKRELMRNIVHADPMFAGASKQLQHLLDGASAPALAVCSPCNECMHD